MLGAESGYSDPSAAHLTGPAKAIASVAIFLVPSICQIALSAWEIVFTISSKTRRGGGGEALSYPKETRDGVLHRTKRDCNVCARLCLEAGSSRFREGTGMSVPSRLRHRRVFVAPMSIATVNSLLTV